MQEEDPLRPSILALGHPLLDVQATVNEAFLRKYSVKANGATLIGPQQNGLHEDLLKNFDLSFVPGGSAQNTIRMIQWILSPSSNSSTCAYLGCVGNDKSGEILLREMEDSGVQTVYEVSQTHSTGICFVLLTGSHRSLITSLGAAAVFSAEFLKSKVAWDMVKAASVYYIMVSIVIHCTLKFP